MRRNDGFAMRNVGGEDLLIPLGSRVRDVNGLMILNNTGSYIWTLLEQDRSLDELVNAVAAHFEVERERAEVDVKAFLGELRRLGAMR